jgi:hypothetical protein
MPNDKKPDEMAGFSMDDIMKLLASVKPENVSQMLEMIKTSLSPEQRVMLESLMNNMFNTKSTKK